MTQPLIDEAALRRSVRTLITVADNVRRGAVPARILHRMVAPQVAQEIVAEFPATPGVSDVRTILLQQPRATLTHFTGTVVRPDDTTVAYLGVITRPNDRDRWQITQVLPVNEMTVGLGLPYDHVGADPPTMERFHLLITAGYLDPAVELLGPIPPEAPAQRHDWLDAATTVREHGEATGLGWQVTQDLQRANDSPAVTWTAARQTIDAYVRTYGVEVERYRDFASRLDAMQGVGASREPLDGREVDR